MNTREQEIVEIALENLYKNTNIDGVWNHNVTNSDDKTRGTITLKINGEVYDIYIEAKTELRNYQINEIENLADTNKPFLIIAKHIFPKIKDELRQKNIGYLEASGNIYLKQPGLYLWIENNKLLTKEKEKRNRAFGKTGLRVVFHFLTNNEFVNDPYRDIAKQAGVGLGNINYVLSGLKDAGYLLKVNKDEYKLVNKKELLEKWMVAYNEKLKPILKIGKFRFLKNEDFLQWKNVQIKTDKTYWGAEPGADLLTHYLKPEILTLYTDESRIEIIKNYRLVPDDDGNIEVYRKFWSYNEMNRNTAPPELIYADLMNTGDGRNIETAQKLFDEYLANKL